LVAQVTDNIVGLLSQVVEAFFQQFFFIFEVLIDGALGYMHLGRDVVHGHFVTTIGNV
jgi:hypothetical protein